MQTAWQYQVPRYLIPGVVFTVVAQFCPSARKKYTLQRVLGLRATLRRMQLINRPTLASPFKPCRLNLHPILGRTPFRLIFAVPCAENTKVPYYIIPGTCTMHTHQTSPHSSLRLHHLHICKWHINRPAAQTPRRIHVLVACQKRL